MPRNASQASLPATPRAVATHVIGGERVVLDADFAALLGVETRRLNEQVRRNHARFEGYAFQLDPTAFAALMSQNATSKSGRGGVRKPPRAFTAKPRADEHIS